MIGIFIFGCFIMAMVATACGLIVAGIWADRRELEELDAQQSPSLRCGHEAGRQPR
jgi:hypothetical protein